MNALILPLRRPSAPPRPLQESGDRCTSQTLSFIISVDARCVYAGWANFLPRARNGRERERDKSYAYPSEFSERTLSARE